MGEDIDADEVKRRTEAVMGTELGELFHLLSEEVTWLHWTWHEYTVLFAEKESRLDLLNRAAPFFFWIVQRNLWWDTMLGISRITDPAVTPSKGKDKENLSIQRLPALLPADKLLEEVRILIADALTAAAFARDWRNRHIAHRDLDLAQGRAPVPLAPATRDGVRNALEALAAVLNRIESHFMAAETAYDICGVHSGAESLLCVLKDGIHWEDLRRDKLRRGEYTPEEWNDPLGPL